MKSISTFLILLALVPQVSHAEVSKECFSLMPKPVLMLPKPLPFGAVNPDFLKNHTKNYDVEIFSPAPIKDQCSTSFCHLYAWSAELENPAEIETSIEYTSAYYLFDSAVKAMFDGNFRFGSALGANAIQSIESIRRSGLIPKEAWKGSTTFNQHPQMSKLTGTLEAIILRATDLRNQTSDPDVIVRINQEAYNQLESTMNSFIGPLPKTFEYKGETYTPHSFAEKFFPHLSRPIVRITNNDGQKLSWGKSFPEGYDLMANIDEIERVARLVLDSGRPIYLGYNHHEQFVDVKTGIMSVGAFKYPVWAAPYTLKERNKFNIWNGGHAVLLTGYEVDPATNKVIKWKIQNSWGTKSGDNGVFHMYDDYFRAFVLGISYLDDGNTPIPAFWEQHQEFIPPSSN